jgi:hypothetical protein
VTSSSSAFESQKQGHFAGGGFSVRVPIDRTPFIHITAPRLSAGCGGIDSFWGGFSFLNPEYLIQKLKNILMAAPAYAFKLALQTLCPQCAETLATLEAIADQLNSLAVDDCRASQTLVNGAASLLDVMGVKSSIGDVTGGGADFLSGVATSVNSWLKKANDEFTNIQADFEKMWDYKYCKGSTQHSDKNKCMEFFRPCGSFWKKAVAMSKEQSHDYQIDEKMVELVTALYGDLIFVIPGIKECGADGDTVSKGSGDGARSGSIRHVQACDTALDSNIDFLTETDEVALQGKRFEIKPEGSCIQIDYEEAKSRFGDYVSIGVKASAAIDKIVTAIINNSTLDSDTIQIVNQSVLPIYTVLNTLTLRKTSGTSPVSESDKSMMAKMLSSSHALYNFVLLNRTAQEYAKSVRIFLSKAGDDGPFSPIEVENALDTMMMSLDSGMLALARKIEESERQYYQHLDSYMKQLQIKTQLQSLISRNLMGKY